MKTIELIQKKATKPATKNGVAMQQPVAVTVGNKPVAALLPMINELVHLAQFTQIIAEEETVTLTLNGQPIAVIETLVPIVLLEDNVDLESLTLSTNAKFLTLIEQSRQHHEAQKGISSADMRRRLGV